jgi:hypothetical protein
MFDPSTDFADVADGTEAVTLLRRGSIPGDAGTPIAHALRRAVNTSEMAALNSSAVRKQMTTDGQCAANDVVWHLPLVELPAAPRLGDIILDAANRRWTILETKQAVFGSRWRCVARDLVVAHRLDDTVTVLQASYAKGTTGAAEATWRTWRTGIRARIQPAECTASVEAQSQETVQKYQIFLAENLEVGHAHRIVGPDGAVYRILSSLGVERIGELQIIQAEVVS